jgi:hypothetical protein
VYNIIKIGGVVMDKEKDLKYIKDFSKITVAGICKDLKIDKSNLWAEKSSAENVAKVKEEIQKRLKELE